MNGFVRPVRTFFAGVISLKRVVIGVVVGYLFMVGIFAVATFVFMVPELLAYWF